VSKLEHDDFGDKDAKKAELDYEEYEEVDYDREHDEAVKPIPASVNNTINVVINPPSVEVVNTITIINTQINDQPVPPAPAPPVTNYIYGTSKKDYLVGTDLDDFIYGYQANDTLIDGAGADKLYGAKGKNTYRCTADGQIDFVYIKKDKQPDIIQFVGLEDRIDIPGSKFDFRSNDRGIEIFSKATLQAVYTGGNLSLSQLQSITV
jgi:hypothetical protein